MTPIDFLSQRVSSARLAEPAPTEAELDQLFRAAARAADHAMLKPYRFLVISGNEDLVALGALFREASLEQDATLTIEQLQRIENLPLRAPMIVIAISCHRPHSKVPEIEQQITTGAAVQNMINAAYTLGLGAYWRTGALAYNSTLKERLLLSDSESIIGFIYLGKPAAPLRALKPADTVVPFAYWPRGE